jgi:hypothetical protein
MSSNGSVARARRLGLGLEFALGMGVLTLAAFGLGACDGAPSAVAARDHGANAAMGPLGQGGGLQSAGQGGGQGAAVQAAAYDGGTRSYAGDQTRSATPSTTDLDAEAPRYQGKPIWAANRMHSSQDNADYQFKKNGADVGASSEDDFIAKAHAFVDHPPEGSETLKRANGDTLVYDAKDNLFAVVAKDGAPRTLFKPRDGATYWATQKADLDKPYTGYRSAAGKSQDDNG